MTDPFETTKSVADASKELSKTVRKIAEFFDKACGGLVVEAAGLVFDKLRFYRWKNAVKLVDQSEVWLAERGIVQTRVVPPKLTLPIFENASLEDDPGLQEIWARLLTNALDPDFDGEITTSFVSILKDMSPMDAKVLLKLCEDFSELPEGTWNLNANSKGRDRLVSLFDLEKSKVELTLANLERVGCIHKLEVGRWAAYGSDNPYPYYGMELFAISELGVKLVEACMKK